jgi:serine/threonine-protein kinase PRP4
MEIGDLASTSELVARFYRAPEIILGYAYDYGIDIWAAACTIYEMYTGSVLFPGKDEHEMLDKIMHVKGRFPRKMVRSGRFAGNYFD